MLYCSMRFNVNSLVKNLYYPANIIYLNSLLLKSKGKDSLIHYFQAVVVI